MRIFQLCLTFVENQTYVRDGIIIITIYQNIAKTLGSHKTSFNRMIGYAKHILKNIIIFWILTNINTTKSINPTHDKPARPYDNPVLTGTFDQYVFGPPMIIVLK